MKNQQILLAMVLSSFIFLSSCEVIGGIFKAGVWSGILIVVLVIALIGFIVYKLFNRKE